MNWNQALIFYITAGVQIALFALAIARGLHKRLPLFTGYIFLLCCASITLKVIYLRYGFQSAPSYYGYWIVDGVLMVMQGFAIADLCRYELRAYRGVWALAWRVLTSLAFFTLLNGVIDAKGQANWIPPFVLAISRDVAISCITVLTALLLIRRYYGIQMERFETMLAGGMIFFSLIDVVNHTIVRNVLLQNADQWHQVRSQLLPLYHLFDTLGSVAFIISLCIWCMAMYRPLPDVARAPQLMPEGLYAELSPALNLQLRSYSDRLLEMLKT